MHYTINHPDEMLAAAKAILVSVPGQKVFVLNGDLGSGKTTFAKGFAHAIGLNEEVSSPTFSIVHEYGEGETRMFHFDLYRIETEQELLQIGFDEYLDSGAYILIEWPALALPFLPRPYISLVFEAPHENKREIICRIVNT